MLLDFNFCRTDATLPLSLAVSEGTMRQQSTLTYDTIDASPLSRADLLDITFQHSPTFMLPHEHDSSSRISFRDRGTLGRSVGLYVRSVLIAAAVATAAIVLSLSLAFLPAKDAARAFVELLPISLVFAVAAIILRGKRRWREIRVFQDGSAEVLLRLGNDSRVESPRTRLVTIGMREVVGRAGKRRWCGWAVTLRLADRFYVLAAKPTAEACRRDFEELATRVGPIAVQHEGPVFVTSVAL